jgi:hypothetical protein
MESLVCICLNSCKGEISLLQSAKEKAFSKSFEIIFIQKVTNPRWLEFSLHLDANGYKIKT